MRSWYEARCGRFTQPTDVQYICVVESVGIKMCSWILSVLPSRYVILPVFRPGWGGKGRMCVCPGGGGGV